MNISGVLPVSGGLQAQQNWVQASCKMAGGSLFGLGYKVVLVITGIWVAWVQQKGHTISQLTSESLLRGLLVLLGQEQQWLLNLRQDWSSGYGPYGSNCIFLASSSSLPLIIMLSSHIGIFQFKCCSNFFSWRPYFLLINVYSVLRFWVKRPCLWTPSLTNNSKINHPSTLFQNNL